MINRECYFYAEDRDMGATIPYCSLNVVRGECPCCCEHFISKSEVRNIVLNLLRDREIPENHGRIVDIDEYFKQNPDSELKRFYEELKDYTIVEAIDSYKMGNYCCIMSY